MAEPYLTHLKQIIERLGPLEISGAMLESRHFFSGAALYANGKIFASLSPEDFAIKLPAERRNSLIEKGKGTEFRFFPNGPIKREYVALTEATIADKESLRELIESGVNYSLGITE